MRREESRNGRGAVLLALLLAAGLAIWLLLRPELVTALPLAWRLPLILLGAWSLGAAFLGPYAVVPRRRWQRRMVSPPWSLLALGLFVLLLAGRALSG